MEFSKREVAVASDTAPSEMSLQQLQEYVAANPNLAASVDPHFQKFVSRDFPLASRYPKPSFMTWKQIYEQFTSLSTPEVSEEEESKEEVDDKKNKNKKLLEEESEKLKEFLEEKKATVVKKMSSGKVKKPKLKPDAAQSAKSAKSVRESLSRRLKLAKKSLRRF